MSHLLEVADLRVEFPAPANRVAVPVDGVTLTVDRGETLALVGESGSGKSLTALALLRLVPSPGRIAPGSRILLDGEDLLALDAPRLRAVRGGRIGIVFQDATTSLNPTLTVGSQLTETIRAHQTITRRGARERAIALLDETGIPEPAVRFGAYPHELSGGLRQRALIAIALAGEPDLLIADEPTTALDVTIQAQILELLDRLRVSRGMAVLLIAHDLGLVAGRADRVAVMYAGQIVEEAATARLFRSPAHPYTRALFRSIPRIDTPVERLSPIGGGVPSPDAWPAACRFHPRCDEVLPRCSVETPPVVPLAPNEAVRCWLAVRDKR
ncbi:MAG TPA: ABC transporter ATP-binding protein [Gemmatimonadales bacterium]|nr:ABC transporter ATP-binding protein [Gemmatimonadales bacterium]